MPKLEPPVLLAADAVPATSLRGAWLRARGLAVRTPASRNRHVDFLRASAICVVVIGHWLMAAPSVERGQFTLSDMLQIAPKTQWLTWIFQVMPIFFLVGGYANAVSWQSARRTGEGYASWVSRRLQRLVRPLVPVLAVALAAVATHLLPAGEYRALLESQRRLADIINDKNVDLLVGMGGGKTIDTAKIAADRAAIPVLIVPTIASTDAPCSGCAVLYSEHGVFESVHYEKSNPAAVLVDTEIIAKAPVRFLVAGMKDDFHYEGNNDLKILLQAYVRKSFALYEQEKQIAALIERLQNH